MFLRWERYFSCLRQCFFFPSRFIIQQWPFMVFHQVFSILYIFFCGLRKLGSLLVCFLFQMVLFCWPWILAIFKWFIQQVFECLLLLCSWEDKNLLSQSLGWKTALFTRAAADHTWLSRNWNVAGPNWYCGVCVKYTGFWRVPSKRI